MKLKNITGFGLALAMAFGVGAAAIAVSSNRANSIEKTRAATDGRFSIIIDDDSWWKSDYAQIWATYSGAGEVRITPDSDLGTVENDGFTWHDIGGSWYAVLTMEVDTSTFTYGHFYFQRKNPSDGSDWGNSDWVLDPSKVKNGTCNTVFINSSSGFEQTWGNYWKITTYSGLTSYASLSGATKSAYFKSASYEFVPEDPSAPAGYEFVGWYTDKGFNTQWTSSSRATADTTLYAKYEAVTAAFNDGDPLTYNSANSQFEAIKYFDANATFHIVKTVGSTDTNYAELDSGMSSSVATSDGTNVTVKVAGTYAVYFKSDNTLWIQIAEDSQIAYMYAGFFLTNVGCDASGVNLPSGWSTCSTRYGTLGASTRNYIRDFDTSKAEEGDDIVEMLDRYELAIRNHPSLTNFMVDGSGNPIVSRAAVIRPVALTGNNNILIIVAVIGTILLISAGGYFFLRKKKEN